MTFEQTLIISILSAVVAGALSIVGVVLTLRQNNKQLIIERRERREEKVQKIWDTRPELEIVDYKQFEIENYSAEHLLYNKDCIFDCIMFRYKDVTESKDADFVVVEYTLKNIGAEMIEYLDFVPLQRGLYCLDLKKYYKKEKFDIELFKDKATKCMTYYEDKIRQGDTKVIRVAYLKDKQPINFPTISCCIAYKSFNKKYWRQNFYVPSKTLEESVLISEQEYNELTTRVE